MEGCRQRPGKGEGVLWGMEWLAGVVWLKQEKIVRKSNLEGNQRVQW